MGRVADRSQVSFPPLLCFVYLASAFTDVGCRVPTQVHLYKGLPHGFRKFGILSAAKAWDNTMEKGILWALSNPQPTTGEVEVF